MVLRIILGRRYPLLYKEYMLKSQSQEYNFLSICGLTLTALYILRSWYSLLKNLTKETKNNFFYVRRKGIKTAVVYAELRGSKETNNLVFPWVYEYLRGLE